MTKDLPHNDLQSQASARLIVCERTGQWAVALRRELTGGGARVCETRSLDDCWQMLAGFPFSFVVVELTRANIDNLLHRLIDSKRQHPRARVAVVADRSLAGYEWLVREAGAVQLLVSRLRLGPLAGVAQRHLAQVPQRRLGLAERIWVELPWSQRSVEAQRAAPPQ